MEAITSRVPEEGARGAVAAATVPDPEVDALVASASRWMGRALTGWADDDPETVGLLAPIAVEHLGKAALWARNPALLVPLANNAESSLHILAGSPSITHPKLRTIGLAVLLDRLERCMDAFPLSNQEKKFLADTRNGAVHVAAKAQSTQIICEALRMCAALVEDLGLEPHSFFGDQHDNVLGILDEQQSEIAARVLVKKARAQKRMAELEDKLDGAVFAELTARLEATAREAFDSWITEADIDHPCPVCGSQGRLGGFLDVVGDVDWDVEKVGDTYESYPVGFWELHFTPMGFGCNVCRLELDRHDELASAGLPSRVYALDRNALDDDFDIDDYAHTSEDFD